MNVNIFIIKNGNVYVLLFKGILGTLYFGARLLVKIYTQIENILKKCINHIINQYIYSIHKSKIQMNLF